jgi:hypothetical protein
MGWTSTHRKRRFSITGRFKTLEAMKVKAGRIVFTISNITLNSIKIGVRVSPVSIDGSCGLA